MRRSALRALPAPDRSQEEGYREWHEPIRGRCEVCGRPGRLIRHHVVLEQHLRAVNQPAWDLRNALLIGIYCDERCHARHHGAFRRIPRSKLPPAAIEFAIELMGAEHADLYFDRYYAP